MIKTREKCIHSPQRYRYIKLWVFLPCVPWLFYVKSLIYGLANTGQWIAAYTRITRPSGLVQVGHLTLTRAWICVAWMSFCSITGTGCCCRHVGAVTASNTIVKSAATWMWAGQWHPVSPDSVWFPCKKDKQTSMVSLVKLGTWHNNMYLFSKLNNQMLLHFYNICVPNERLLQNDSNVLCSSNRQGSPLFPAKCSLSGWQEFDTRFVVQLILEIRSKPVQLGR